MEMSATMVRKWPKVNVVLMYWSAKWHTTISLLQKI